jgi:dTDP-4-amino-4,6-dideoxygalactose transaminase
VLEPGLKANLPDILAAVGLTQFRRRYEMQRKRVEIARGYFELMGGSDIKLPPYAGDFQNHAWHLFVVRMPKSVNRDAVMDSLKSHGVGCSLHYRPLHQHRYYREKFFLDSKSFPNSEAVFRSAISLPIFPDMTMDQVEYVSRVLKESMSAS